MYNSGLDSAHMWTSRGMMNANAQQQGKLTSQHAHCTRPIPADADMIIASSPIIHLLLLSITNSSGYQILLLLFCVYRGMVQIHRRCYMYYFRNVIMGFSYYFEIIIYNTNGCVLYVRLDFIISFNF